MVSERVASRQLFTPHLLSSIDAQTFKDAIHEAFPTANPLWTVVRFMLNKYNPDVKSCYIKIVAKDIQAELHQAAAINCELRDWVGVPPRPEKSEKPKIQSLADFKNTQNSHFKFYKSKKQKEWSYDTNN